MFFFSKILSTKNASQDYIFFFMFVQLFLLWRWAWAKILESHLPFTVVVYAVINRIIAKFTLRCPLRGFHFRFWLWISSVQFFNFSISHDSRKTNPITKAHFASKSIFLQSIHSNRQKFALKRRSITRILMKRVKYAYR